MRSALVTGGCGFVGRHFVKRLVDDGWETTSVDNMSTGISWNKWLYKPRRLDYFYKDDLRDFVKQCNPDEFDLIIHCAAVVGGRMKIEGDSLAVATDLAIDADFFNWIARSKNKQTKVVYFSSSAVYPVELQREFSHCALHESLVDLNRSRIGMPDQTYGWSKLTGELLAQHAVHTYNTDVVIYRPFSGYGEDQSPDYPFPALMRRIAAREDPITIWGSGRQIRDFIHIDDIVEGVMSTYAGAVPGDVMNLGTGRKTTFKSLVEMAAAQVGYSPEIRVDLTRPEGVFARYSDEPRTEITVELPAGIRRMLKHLDKTLQPV